MKDILIKLARGDMPTDGELAVVLSDVCDLRRPDECETSCPAAIVNGGIERPMKPQKGG